MWFEKFQFSEDARLCEISPHVDNVFQRRKMNFTMVLENVQFEDYQSTTAEYIFKEE